MWLKGKLKFHVDENGVSQLGFLEDGKPDSDIYLLESGDNLKVYGKQDGAGQIRFEGSFAYRTTSAYVARSRRDVILKDVLVDVFISSKLRTGPGGHGYSDLEENNSWFLSAFQEGRPAELEIF